MSSPGLHGNEKRNVRGRPAPHPGRRTLTAAQWALARNAFAFTTREVEVAQCLFDTPHRPYIANTLGISVKTVDTHLRRIFAKAEVDDHADLILAVIDRALLPHDPKPPGSTENGKTPTA